MGMGGVMGVEFSNTTAAAVAAQTWYGGNRVKLKCTKWSKFGGTSDISRVTKLGDEKFSYS
eukprot:scaffold85426_cov23-Cyclotella_meneghiniana.AAC.1